MQKWFVQKSGKESGPYSPAELRQLAASGEIEPTDAVRRDDSDAWLAAGRIRGLFPPPSANEASIAPVDSAAPGWFAGLPDDNRKLRYQRKTVSLAKAVRAAMQIGAKRAQLMSATWDLNRADETLGGECHQRSLFRDAYPDTYERIARIDSEVEAKRQPLPVPASEAVSDKVRRLAHGAKNRIEVESLLLQRRNSVRELGESVRLSSESLGASGLEQHLGHARDLAAKVSGLNAAVAELTDDSRGVIRRAAARAIAIGLILLLLWFSPALYRFAGSVATGKNYQIGGTVGGRTANSPQARQPAKKPVADTDRQPEAVAAAVRRLELEREALEREKERHREQDRLRALAAQRAEAKRQEEAKQSTEDEVVALADKLFGELPVDPAKSVHLCRALRIGDLSRLELRGVGYKEIASLYAERRWPELGKFVGVGNGKAFASTAEVRQAISSLKGRQLQCLVVTDRRNGNGLQSPALFRIQIEPFRDSSDYQPITIREIRDEHPDGIGYLFPWEPQSASSVIVWAKQNDIYPMVRGFSERLREIRADLKKRLLIGEISREDMNERMATAIRETLERCIEWSDSF